MDGGGVVEAQMRQSSAVLFSLVSDNVISNRPHSPFRYLSLPPSLSLSLFPLSRFPAYFGAIVPAIKVSDIVQCLVLLFYLIYF